MGNNNRLLSLDVMRGITIAGMILVNNPGDWTHVYAPLAHAHWNGFTPTDMVFPFFMFMMGVSAYFSLRKYDFTWNNACVWKIVKRTVVIFFIGLALNGLSLAMFGGLEWERWRILGVLQRLALAYGVASFIAISIPHKYLLHTAISLLILHSALLLGTHSLELTPDSLVAVIDRAVLGESHLYRDVMADGTRIAWEDDYFPTEKPREDRYKPVRLWLYFIVLWPVIELCGAYQQEDLEQYVRTRDVRIRFAPPGTFDVWHRYPQAYGVDALLRDVWRQSALPLCAGRTLGTPGGLFRMGRCGDARSIDTSIGGLSRLVGLGVIVRAGQLGARAFPLQTAYIH